MCISVNVVADYIKSNCIELYDEIYNRGFADGLKIDKEEERNNAIDDFVNEFIDRLRYDEAITYVDSDKCLAVSRGSVQTLALKIAKQLKEGD